MDRSSGPHLVHYFAAATVSTDRQTAADDLPERGNVGRDVVESLRAAPSNAKTRHHFIKYQQRVLIARQPAYAFEKTVTRRHAAHVSDDGLDDHGSDVAV